MIMRTLLVYKTILNMAMLVVLWKEVTQMFTDFFQIEMFQTTIVRIVKHYHNQHDFCL